MSLEIKGVSYVYMPGSPFAAQALHDVSIAVRDGEFLGLIGHTGSGKSTLVQLFNGLLKPSSGQVVVDGEDIWQKGLNKRAVRQKVGLVFQYPEYQLFEETVAKDVAFGPRNIGLPEADIERRVSQSLARVGLSDDIRDRSPFELSGGQKRRVAIAGVLALEPRTLVLDEPTAGLDPKGREEILAMVCDLHAGGCTVVMVSHSMDDVARFADRIAVMNGGRLAMLGAPRDVFARAEELQAMGLDVPEAARLVHELRRCGWDLPGDIYTLDAAREAIVGAWRAGREGGGHA